LPGHLQIDADYDQDPAYHFDADPYPDSAYHFDADPDADSAYHFDADPYHTFSLIRIRNTVFFKIPLGPFLNIQFYFYLFLIPFPVLSWAIFRA
jgi:hypothetical protein